MCSAESSQDDLDLGRDATRTDMMIVCGRKNGKRDTSVDADIAKNEPRSSCAWIWFDMRSACAVSKRDQQAGEGKKSLLSRGAARSSHPASHRQGRAVLEIVYCVSGGERTRVHGEASAPPRTKHFQAGEGMLRWRIGAKFENSASIAGNGATPSAPQLRISRVWGGISSKYSAK